MRTCSPDAAVTWMSLCETIKAVSILLFYLILFAGSRNSSEQNQRPEKWNKIFFFLQNWLNLTGNELKLTQTIPKVHICNWWEKLKCLWFWKPKAPVLMRSARCVLLPWQAADMQWRWTRFLSFLFSVKVQYFAAVVTHERLCLKQSLESVAQ